jgi:hypothetical protein
VHPALLRLVQGAMIRRCASARPPISIFDGNFVGIGGRLHELFV